MIYATCFYCQSMWWHPLWGTSWFLCRMCFASRDARTGWTLSPDRLN